MYLCSPTAHKSPFASPERFSEGSVSSSVSTEAFGRGLLQSPRATEQMTAAQQEGLVTIDQNDREMDEQLDEIGAGVKELGVMARGINDVRVCPKLPQYDS